MSRQTDDIGKKRPKNFHYSTQALAQIQQEFIGHIKHVLSLMLPMAFKISWNAVIKSWLLNNLQPNKMLFGRLQPAEETFCANM